MQPPAETLELRLEDEQTRQRRSTGARRGWVTRRHRAARRLERAIVKVIAAWSEYSDDPRSTTPVGKAIEELETAWHRRDGARFS